PLMDFSGKAKLVGPDPRFALTVRIESAAPAVADFAAGAVVTFGIHSPVKLFGGSPAKGETYNFVLHCRNEAGEASFTHLEVRRVPARKSSNGEARTAAGELRVELPAWRYVFSAAHRQVSLGIDPEHALQALTHE